MRGAVSSHSRAAFLARNPKGRPNTSTLLKHRFSRSQRRSTDLTAQKRQSASTTSRFSSKDPLILSWRIRRASPTRSPSWELHSPNITWKKSAVSRPIWLLRLMRMMQDLRRHRKQRASRLRRAWTSRSRRFPKEKTRPMSF